VERVGAGGIDVAVVQRGARFGVFGAMDGHADRAGEWQFRLQYHHQWAWKALGDAVGQSDANGGD
jgi:hypothetical protein